MSAIRAKNVLLSTALIVALGSAGASDRATAKGSEPKAHPVSLWDATVAPSELAYLKPGKSVTFASEDDGYNCTNAKGRGTGWFTDTSAYGWNGEAVGAQRWNADHTVTYWMVAHRRVTFDGITFRNHSKLSVIVAGWCD